jgi:hypothetical protein
VALKPRHPRRLIPIVRKIAERGCIGLAVRKHPISRSNVRPACGSTRRFRLGRLWALDIGLWTGVKMSMNYSRAAALNPETTFGPPTKPLLHIRTACQTLQAGFFMNRSANQRFHSPKSPFQNERSETIQATWRNERKHKTRPSEWLIDNNQRV